VHEVSAVAAVRPIAPRRWQLLWAVPKHSAGQQHGQARPVRGACKTVSPLAAGRFATGISV